MGKTEISRAYLQNVGFRGISEVRMELMGEEIVKVTNLREVPRKILSLMGKECEKYYN